MFCAYFITEVEKLLLVSSGSSLVHIFQTADGKKHHHSPMNQLQTQGVLFPELVRPSFALVSLTIRERELSKYHLSQLLSSLPSDVYVMVNPLQEHHLRQVAALIKAIRMELVVVQRRSVKDNSEDDDGAMSVDSDASRTHQQWQLLTDFRRMQKATDLSAAQLLHDLQRRTNFHSMWHATP